MTRTTSFNESPSARNRIWWTSATASAPADVSGQNYFSDPGSPDINRSYDGTPSQ
jgi:hypothetical protein